jgi:hypothetical protein
MKTKIALLMVTALLSLSAMAVEPQTVILADGSTATVLSQNGKITTYLKEANANADGKVQLVPGQVFDGERLVKKENGQCLMIRQRVVSMDDVSVGDVKVQRPKTTSESTVANCSS